MDWGDQGDMTIKYKEILDWILKQKKNPRFLDKPGAIKQAL